MTSIHEAGAGAHEKTYQIIVNGRPRKWSDDKISYNDLVGLAYNNNPPTGQDVVITVTYSKGVDRDQGSLLPGDSVPVKSGMVFDVTATTRS